MGRRQRPATPAASPPASPRRGTEEEPEELDLEAFSQSLHPSGLCIRDVSNDGNCFFRAVSDQLYGTEDYHMKLRERACDFLQLNKNYYKFFIDDEQSFDDYVADMRNDGVWADNLELQAISMAYKVNIRVHQSGKPSYDIRNHPGKSAQAIHISYHFAEHYASVRPLRTAHLNVPAQHHPLPVPRVPVSNPDNVPETMEGATRRPRRRVVPAVEEDSVAAVWKRANRGHKDVYDLVERTYRTARGIRGADAGSAGMDSRKDAARRVEKDMKEARARLLELQKGIEEGKNAHRFHSKKIVHSPRDRSRDAELSDSDAVSSYSEDDGQEAEQYEKTVRRETDVIFEKLNEIENAVRIATEKVAALTMEKAVESSSSSKHSRGSKKKEQEAKRRERKDKRRREQERIARGEGDDINGPPFRKASELDIAI